MSDSALWYLVLLECNSQGRKGEANKTTRVTSLPATMIPIERMSVSNVIHVIQYPTPIYSIPFFSSKDMFLGSHPQVI